jgi:pimeloyl-ACP methyl ester carboxylesterase
MAMTTKPPVRLEVLTRQPEADARETPLLFVHGAWHGAWCWGEHFLPYVAAHGYRCYAVSLRGHGASESPRHFRTVRIRDYVDDVAYAAAQMDRPPVVIGHSMGGLVVQKYLERHAAPGGILLASVPPRGVLRTTLNIARKHPLRFARANLTWKLYPLVNTPRIAREMLFSRGLPADRVEAY